MELKAILILIGHLECAGFLEPGIRKKQAPLQVAKTGKAHSWGRHKWTGARLG